MSSRRHSSRVEERYRKRFIGDVEYHTSRSGYGDASLVAYRFPCQVPEKDGPDFVLVHGIGVSARMYGPTAVELAQRGDVHLIDMAGYGRSPRPSRDLTIADHAELIARYLEEHELERPVVVGHSMGAQVVAELAAGFPDQVDHIALIAPVIAPTARTLAKVGPLLLANGLKEPGLVTFLAVYDYFFRAGIPYMIQQTPHLLATDLDDIAARVAAKTLVICGLDDPIVPLEWGKELADAFRHGWYASVPGPHATMFAAPRTIAALIDEHAHR
ncbi:MAG: alpha/beta fold hydrolase [Tessaracoccus sp.]|uniref:alpha/beta fold hydrolase n=1 Tax=Tessaracoccus sp. TaxID=1971211 RepID=UPI001EBB80F4|nr:alpha/beta fold hydrolase [Tessaracoccus sp.]MBK7821037.1 alpha/beta fold hydrolase [Tessaracoccus sp.]